MWWINDKTSVSYKTHFHRWMNDLICHLFLIIRIKTEDQCFNEWMWGSPFPPTWLQQFKQMLSKLEDEYCCKRARLFYLIQC